MSKLAEYRQLEKYLAEQLQAFQILKEDVGLQKEIDFENKLRFLLAKYGYSLKDIINLIDPPVGYCTSLAVPVSNTRKVRAVKVYKNPHTGEIIETKGGNHRGLKLWKTEHGVGTVESWLSSLI